VIETDIPARLDRLPWSRWHWRVVIALGVTWLLDGLEVTLVGSLGSVLMEPTTLALTPTEVGASASAYLFGAITGSLVFGRLADQLGRKRLFLVTLAVYLVATAATALSFGFVSFGLCRLVTGMGIGGECAAMNSAIDEIVPARVRGFTDLALNSTYWIGAAAGSAASAILLSPRVLGHEYGWRAAFGLGATVGLSILVVRRDLPESPRWLVTHGFTEEAERAMQEIEAKVSRGSALPPAFAKMQIEAHPRMSIARVIRELFGRERRRSFLGLTLMVSQAFFYNAVFFTYALVLSRFYGVAPEHIGLYLVPFAAGNALGPLLLGRFFDSIGRRRMIVFTYAAASLLLFVSAWLFARGLLDARTQTLAWAAIFFVASAAASSAYLTVSEVFPLEMRALAIAAFYSLGTAVGGLAAPAIFGALIATGRRGLLAIGYAFAATLLAAAAIVAWRLAIDAEGKSLEEVTGRVKERAESG
jgi:MFS family permease